MMALGKCILDIGHGIPVPRTYGVVELPVYFTKDCKIPNTFEEYLDIHEKVLSLWDVSTRRYRNGKYVSGSSQHCTVYLPDLGIYVRWRKTPSFTSNAEVLVGEPFLRGKIWCIYCFKPDESTLKDIKNCWNTEQGRFRNSVFLRKDGNRIWVYLRDLKICVGWIKGYGSQIFGDDNSGKLKWYDVLSDPYDPILELRKKINNCYGCWH